MQTHAKVTPTTDEAQGGEGGAPQEARRTKRATSERRSRSRPQRGGSLSDSGAIGVREGQSARQSRTTAWLKRESCNADTQTRAGPRRPGAHLSGL